MEKNFWKKNFSGKYPKRNGKNFVVAIFWELKNPKKNFQNKWKKIFGKINFPENTQKEMEKILSSPFYPQNKNYIIKISQKKIL